jgi:hypothetical protein
MFIGAHVVRTDCAPIAASVTIQQCHCIGIRLFKELDRARSRDYVTELE